MKGIKLTNDQKHLLEKFGVLQERSGMQPAAARITALLLVADKPELTFDEIQQTLMLSKSAVSNAIAMLLNLEKITYVTYTGDRKRYFRSNIVQWESDVRKSFDGVSSMSKILKEILEQRPKSTKALNQSINEVISFFDLFDKEIPLLFKKWNDSQKKS